MVQADFAYIKAYGDKQVLPVLTAIDAETGMAMAVQVQDKSQQFHYLVKYLQTFLYECGRAQASLSPTTLPPDQEDYLIQLLKATALAIYAVYLLNRYAVHNDGQTSYQRRWG